MSSTPTLARLPANPSTCRTLSDADARRLAQTGQAKWLDPNATCVTCQRTGAFRARGKGGLAVETACDCIEQWKLYRWMLNAGIGLRYQRQSWNDVVQAPIVVTQAVLDYEDHSLANVAAGMGLTLGSPSTGTGKTMLHALLAKRLLAKGHDVYFTQFNDMLDAFSAGWRDEDERRWFLRRVRNAGVLFVDDIGREHKGRHEVAESMFDTVIRHRVASSMPTMITTNYPEAALLQGLGGNVLSLLSEVNRYVDASGKDFRPQARERTLRDGQDGIQRPITVD